MSRRSRDLAATCRIGPSPRRREPIRWRRLLLTATALLVAGCGVPTDNAPRAIDGVEPIVGEQTGSGSASTGADRIFLVAPGESRLLRSVPRSAGSPRNLIEILLDGPNKEELDDQWISQIPAGTQLLDFSPQGAVLFLDLTSELTTLPPPVQRQALAQIVYTAAEIDGVTGVQITFEGKVQALPKGNGDATTGELTPYDFPGYVQTAQPAYPAVVPG